MTLVIHDMSEERVNVARPCGRPADMKTNSNAPFSRRRLSSGFVLQALAFLGGAAVTALVAGCGSNEKIQWGTSEAGSTSSGTGDMGGQGGSGGGSNGGAGGMGGSGGSSETWPVKYDFLPVLQIDTNGVQIIEDVKVDGKLVVIEDHDGTLKDLANRPHAFEGPIGIEVRGSSSTSFPKKSFGMEMRDAAGQDMDVSFFGMPAESDWVLYGPYTDKTYMRDKLTYDLARALGRYAPRSQFVEVFVNDNFIGVYVFLEKIKRNSGRVNIPKVAASAASGDISGGYIVKLEAGNPDGGFFSALGTAWQYHYPRFDTITPEQTTYIQGYIDSFEKVMLGPNFADPQKGYQALIDVDSFVDFVIINELGRNVDGYRKSTYMHKQSDANGGRVYMGPVWDFNLAFGNADYCDGFRTDDFVYMGGNCPDVVDQIPDWWLFLMADPVFTKALRCRWETLRTGVLSDAEILQRIDAYREEVTLAEPRDHARWGTIGGYIWPNYFIGNTYGEEVDYVKQWLVQRTAWLDVHLPGTCK